ncbi:ankyrin repeat domain-containing protein [bacterium]|nr:ankyrin repeat domain-containing protein [bacterium]
MNKEVYDRKQLKRLENCTHRVDSRLTMKSQLIGIVAALLVVGCGTTPSPELPTAKAPDISIHEATGRGDIEAVKQHLAAGTDVNTKDDAHGGTTPLHIAASVGRKEIAELLIVNGAEVNAKIGGGSAPLHFAATQDHKEIVELLIAKGADVNAKIEDGRTPLDMAIFLKQTLNQTETADLLRKHGGKTGEELKAEGK